MDALQQIVCSLCNQPAHAVVQGNLNLGALLGPVGDTEYYIHRSCALWSPEVHQADNGRLVNVLIEIRRGRQLKCSHCVRRGATLGCRVPKCSNTYHLPCATEAECTFFENHLVACKTHAKRFKRDPIHPAPFGYPDILPSPGPASNHPPDSVPVKDLAYAAADAGPTPAAAKTAAARKRRKLAEAQDRAANADAILRHAHEYRRRNDENESSDDEEHFRKKESARLARDIAKLNPITLAGGGKEGEAVQHVYLKPAHKIKGIIPPPDVVPITETAAVQSITEVDFSSLGGLQAVVQQLKEMVMLPLLYPAVFPALGVQPPRGILFYGPPGTGKTMAARALAGACAKQSPVPVTFFARKGADCLGKFSGEAERTLRLLFQEAQARAPSIIFLDELDALVPPRSARSGGADQIYASVVSTLLALMDGINDRGNVVVIGATNRPESIDPGLRRPGRFDREVFFQLPDAQQRREILDIHTRKWPTQPDGGLLHQIAAATEGFAGADLKALTAAAVLSAVRRKVPTLMASIDQQQREEEVEQQKVDESKKVRKEDENKDLPTYSQNPASALEVVEPPTTAAPTQPPPPPPPPPPPQPTADILATIQVESIDWEAALAAAPSPCSQREGVAALTSDYKAAVPSYVAPLLSHTLAGLVNLLAKSGLPLPKSVLTAATAAADFRVVEPDSSKGNDTSSVDDGVVTRKRADCFLDTLKALGAVASNDGITAASPAPPLPLERPPTDGRGVVQPPLEHSSLDQQHPLHQQQHELGSLGWNRSWPPCRILLSGAGELGQEAVTGAILRLLQGCPLQVISLPTLIAQGGDSLGASCVALVGEALRRAPAGKACVFYLPRVETWALWQSELEVDEGSTESDDAADAGGGRVFDEACTPNKKSYFPVAPSPFGGLIPLDQIRLATPAASAFTPGRNGKQQQRTPASTANKKLLQAKEAIENAALHTGSTNNRDNYNEKVGEEQGFKRVVGVSVVSEAWSVFESLIRQAPASQPLIILATCHEESKSIPTAFSDFFTATSLTTRTTAQNTDTAAAAAAVAGVGVGGACAGSIEMTPPSEEQYIMAVQAASEQAATAVVDAVVSVLRSQLLSTISAAAAVAAAPVTPPANIQLVNVQSTEPHKSDDIDNDELYVVDKTRHYTKKKDEVSNVELSSALLNEELTRGLQLHAQIMLFMSQLGIQLLADGRSEAATVKVPGRGNMQHRMLSFRDVALRAANGEYSGLEEMRQDASETAKKIVQVVERAQQRRIKESRLLSISGNNNNGPVCGLTMQPPVYSAAAAAACALVDEIDARCSALSSTWSLHDPGVRKILKAARLRVDDLAVQQRKELERQLMIEEDEGGLETEIELDDDDDKKEGEEEHQYHQLEEGDVDVDAEEEEEEQGNTACVPDAAALSGHVDNLNRENNHEDQISGGTEDQQQRQQQQQLLESDTLAASASLEETNNDPAAAAGKDTYNTNSQHLTLDPTGHSHPSGHLDPMDIDQTSDTIELPVQSSGSDNTNVLEPAMAAFSASLKAQLTPHFTAQIKSWLPCSPAVTVRGLEDVLGAVVMKGIAVGKGLGLLLDGDGVEPGMNEEEAKWLAVKYATALTKRLE